MSDLESSPQLSNPPTHQLPDYPTTESSTIFVGGVAMIVVAALLLLCGACSALLYLVIPLAVKDAPLATQSNIIWGSLAGVGIFLGVVLVWQGASAVRGRESRAAARVFPSFTLLVIAFLFAIAVGLGTLVLSRFEASPAAAYLFPPWHVIAACLMPLVFLAYAARRLGTRSSLRALVTSFSWGALGGTFLASLLEMAIGVALVAVAMIALSLTPEGEAFLQQLQTPSRFGPRLGENAQILRLVSHPIIALSVLFYFVIVIPLIEEIVKTITVAFADPRRTRLADAVLWGISAGAGFAVLENTLNASLGLANWALTMSLRVGATALHVANGATMGRGWYAARVERRWSRLFIAYGVSVFLHALWNAAAIVMGGNALFMPDNANLNLGTQFPANLLTVALSGTLVLLTLLSLVRIVLATRSACEPLPSPS